VERFYYGCAKFQSWPSNSEILRDKNVKTLIIASQFLMKKRNDFNKNFIPFISSMLLAFNEYISEYIIHVMKANVMVANNSIQLSG